MQSNQTVLINALSRLCVPLGTPAGVQYCAWMHTGRRVSRSPGASGLSLPCSHFPCSPGSCGTHVLNANTVCAGASLGEGKETCPLTHTFRFPVSLLHKKRNDFRYSTTLQFDALHPFIWNYFFFNFLNYF